MNVVVLAGSPKGSESVTAEYVRYLAARRPDDTFTFVYAAYSHRKYERHPDALTKVLDTVASADLVLWAFPVYFLLVSSGYKRFIELVFAHDSADVFRNRYTASLSTSIHFYDHTAHNYIHGVCDDLGTRHLGAFAAGMHDLLETDTREQLVRWFSGIEARIVRDEQPPHRYAPLDEAMPEYKPAQAPQAETSQAETLQDETPRSERSSSHHITIVTDGASPNIKAMLNRFRRSHPSANVVDLSALRFGHCMGCLKCGFDNQCAYEGTKDEFVEMLRSKVLRAEAVVFAVTMRDRYFSSLWQRYLERTFVYTHQPRLEGKQIAFLVAGPLRENENAREILMSYTEVMRGHMVDIVTDEAVRDDVRRPQEPEATLDHEIDALAASVTDALELGLHPPVTFRGVAGLRLFRDEIFGGLGFVFQGDDTYYRKHGLYDFPNRRRGPRIQAAIMKTLSKVPGLRGQIRNRLQSEMVKPLQKVVDATSSQSVDRDHW